MADSKTLSKRSEIVAAALTCAVLVGIPAWVIWTDRVFASVDDVPDARVLTLTAVANGGIWTEDDVVGHSYWRRKPTPTERVFLHENETFVIRFKSADVNHSYAVPDLNIGPVPIGPGYVSELWFVPTESGPAGWNVHTIAKGHVADVRFVPAQPGEYLSQCTAWCGHCHEEMRGTFIVVGAGQSDSDYPGGVLPPRKKCPLHAQEPS